ncbi:MAG: zinc ribbon domain-containing protein [Thermoplasmata archaeon]|nr:zinc ribbon domain-containing protein [Thermoplasmata archaeon]
MAERPNYCQLLGLNPLKDASYTAESISKKIDGKRDKWANDSRNKQNDTEQRFKSERLVEMTEDMRRVMNDPILRGKEFREGQNLLKSKVQKLRMDCVILTDGSYVALPGMADAYTKKLHWEGVTKADVLKLANIREGAPPKPANDKILNAYKGLRSVDAYTPVEMLNALIGHPNLEISLDPLGEGSSATQVRTAFEVCDKRVNSVRPDVLPEQDSYIQAMRSVKLVLSPDSDLAILVAYGRCNRALVPVMETLEQEYTSQLSRKYIDELLNAHLPRDVDGAMALKILQQFCYKKKIAANFSDTDSSMVRCPECGNMVQAGPNAVFCPACGKNFKTVCPVCSTSQQSKNAVCIKCGFNFKEGQARAERYSMNFRTSMQRGQILQAEKALAQLREVYPGYGSTAAMTAELAKAKGDVAASRKFILDAYSRGRYFEAMSSIEALSSRFPEAVDSDIELKQKLKDCTARLNEADMYCQRAKAASTRPERMQQYVNACEACPDHPEARAKLRENPPPGPVDASGKLGDRSFTIRFVAPPDDSNGTITYCIFRERGSLPSVTEDTRPLAEIPTSVYVDKTLDPGVEYYYSVYSKRWGVLSKEAAHIGPVVTISEVDRVTIEPIDGGLRIMYEKPRGATRVRLWRSDGRNSGAVGTEIALHGQDVYDDIGLVGGKKYYYLFVAEYEVRNKVERSEGVVFSETAVDAPKPVRDLKIRWNKSDGTYTAKWGTSEAVELYSTPKKINISGTMMKMDDVRSWMTRIEPIAEYVDGIKFALPDGAVQYVYPMIPRGRMCIRGTELLVANLKPFRDVEWNLSNRDCVITMGWPEEAVEAKLVISNGTEARGLDDIDAETVTIRRDEYMQDRQIRIPMGKQRKKCINVFAVYSLDGTMQPSRGIVLEINSGDSRKVRYRIDHDRNGTTISLTTDRGIAALPPMMLVQASRGIPLKRTDGEVVWRSGGPVAAQDGTAVVKASCRGLEDIERCRLFLADDSDYYEFRFIHPLYGRD